jgi:hypothetical protein|mmetsp:Transcript_39965/g.64888  ORF Transcript_39965/g.64888 Transcript_39965/m.64888 type:complete len:112 (+) Transcript_39965:1496-1831(+)
MQHDFSVFFFGDLSLLHLAGAAWSFAAGMAYVLQCITTRRQLFPDAAARELNMRDFLFRRQLPHWLQPHYGALPHNTTMSVLSSGSVIFNFDNRSGRSHVWRWYFLLLIKS